MSKILVVSTCKDKLHELEFVKPIEDILFSENIAFFVKHYTELKNSDLTKCSKVIICGTSLQDFDYFNNIDKFSWIKEFVKPIFGICAGSQVLVSLFRGRLFERGKKILDRKEIGFVVCNFKKEFLGFFGNYEVYGLHQLGIGIGEKSSFLEAYGFSNRGVQAFKHKEKEIYGVLFHPEVRQKKLILEFAK
jgi:GMP synthase (glutamine-hydrolysing)